MFGQIGRLINRIALSDRNYRFLFEAEPGNEAVSLDCENTGFDHWVDEIVSVAAIQIVGRRIEASTVFRALVKPDSAIRPASIKVHQLREIDVAGSRPMAEVLPDLLHFIGSRPERTKRTALVCEYDAAEGWRIIEGMRGGCYCAASWRGILAGQRGRNG